MTNNISIFSGNSNSNLAKAIANELEIELGKIKLEKFANDENYVQFCENIRGKDVFLIQTSTKPINDNLMELLIMIDAAKRASAGRITAVIPNYFYARQDRKVASREPITSKLVADLLITAGTNRILTIDLHCGQIQGFFNIPFDNLTTENLFIAKAKEIIQNEIVIVAPDSGAAKKTTKIARKMNVELAIINKIRTMHNKAEGLNIIGAEITNKDCLIFDDMVDTGGSLCVSAEMLKEKNAKKVYAFITHGIFSGDAIEKIEKSAIDKVFITDTVPLQKKSKKIEIISIAPLLAETIRRTHNNESVSSLFE